MLPPELAGRKAGLSLEKTAEESRIGEVIPGEETTACGSLLQAASHLGDSKLLHLSSHKAR